MGTQPGVVGAEATLKRTAAMKRTNLMTTTALIAGLMSAPAFALDINAGGKVNAGARAV